MSTAKGKKLNVGEARLTAFLTTLQEELSACDSTNPAVVRQMQRARKRARFVSNHDKLQSEAIAKFLAINEKVGELQKCNPPSSRLDKDVMSNARYFITTVLERFTSTFDELAVQSPLELAYLFDHWRFGPGSSHGVKGTHTAEKIGQDMTCTALCEPLVNRLRSTNLYLSASDGQRGSTGTQQVRGSKLATVSKNEDTNRTIAVEPSGNMCLQLAAGAYLEGALRYIGLDIRTQQPKNKAMAKRGSEDGSVATLDLSSASDMISLDLVRALMPPKWVVLLETLRSPEILVREDKSSEGKWVQLNMISTMGNGFTFPLMTLLIVSLIYGYRCSRGGPSLYIDWTNTCVFGDDIIVPTHEYEQCVETLTQAGLVVNYDKSFCEGPFRESCGGDYLNGRDITPFYVKSLANELDVYVVINQVLSWSGRESITLPRTLTGLRTMLRGRPHLVPEWMGANQGVQTSGCLRRYSYLRLQPRAQELPKENLFAMPLAVGGYIEEIGGRLFFVPRSNQPPKARVCRTRLPKGYLDGWDPVMRSQQVSSWIAARVAIFFGH